MVCGVVADVRENNTFEQLDLRLCKKAVSFSLRSGNAKRGLNYHDEAQT